MENPTQSILITGASRGLGAAAALRAAQMGASVALNARTAADLETAAEGIHKLGRDAFVIAGDISQPDFCFELIERTVAHFGSLDALVNNAGVLEPITRIADGDPQGWMENLAVNLLGPMLLIKAALPFLRISAGRVINVSSGAAVNPVQGWGVYCAAKAALNQFTNVLAAEEPEVTAISFRPGVVDTTMQAKIRRDGPAGMPAGEHARFVRYHSEGLLLPPERPGASLAALALYAPPDWSGEFLSWDEERVLALLAGHTPQA